MKLTEQSYQNCLEHFSECIVSIIFDIILSYVNIFELWMSTEKYEHFRGWYLTRSKLFTQFQEIIIEVRTNFKTCQQICIRFKGYPLVENYIMNRYIDILYSSRINSTICFLFYLAQQFLIYFWRWTKIFIWYWIYFNK